MPRRFDGQIRVRVPSSLHKEVAKEAFEKGTPISEIFNQALMLRKVLKNRDPWKSICAVQSANRGIA
jgi:hypothetical protein